MTSSNITTNPNQLRCLTCPSIILKPGVGTCENTEFQLPHMQKKSVETDETELITKCWVVKDMFQFENVGFSNTIGNFKYLTCADCEMGPIGWHSLETKINYVADQRVKHYS